MKKDEALRWQTRMAELAALATVPPGHPTLVDDGRLFHDEVGARARWAQRLSVAGHWPHGSAAPPRPGLRYEVWYFQKAGATWGPGPAADKQKALARGDRLEEPLFLLALCSRGPGLEGLANALAPVFQALIEGGKYARRYTELDPFVQQMYPEVTGVGRLGSAGPKGEAAWTKFIQDTLGPLQAAVTAWNPDAAEFFEASSPLDPLAALKDRFRSLS